MSPTTASPRSRTLFLIAVHGAIFVLVVAGVVLRYVFNDPLTWGEEVIVGLFTWMVFIGAAAAVRSHMHIRIDVMAPVYANPKMSWLNALTVLTGVAIIVVMIYACTLQVLQEAVGRDARCSTCREAWFLASMPVGLMLMLLHVLRLWLDKGPAAVFKGETESADRGCAADDPPARRFVVLLVIGLPIALAMMGASALFIVVEGIPLSVVAQRVVTGVQSFPLLAIPLFTLAGSLMNESGISERLFSLHPRVRRPHPRRPRADGDRRQRLPVRDLRVVGGRLRGHLARVRAAARRRPATAQALPPRSAPPARRSGRSFRRRS